MRHGTHTIIISTPEQAEAMLEHLEQCQVSARADDYASERKKPIKWMTCTCCGESYQGRQWCDMEPGYGLGDCCVDYCGADRKPGTESECYGVSGIHFLIDQADKDNPPLIEDRGEPLYGMDERLRIEYDGYVYWKGRQIEHYSGAALHDTDKNKAEARELIRRCELLEARGVEISSSTVIWRWQDAPE